MKLQILRLSIITFASIVISVWRLLGSKEDSKLARIAIPLIWLRHYLLGSGKDLRVPNRYCYGALSVFKKALDTGGHVEHSMYQGSSFYEKPILFYILGGFSYELQEKDDVVTIKGTDCYDWHPVKVGEMELYPFTPLHISSRLLKTAFLITQKIFGDEYFVSSSEFGISDKLWHDMLQVGAKEFSSTFEFTVSSNVLENKEEVQKC